MATSKRSRAFALGGAILFLITGSALTIAVVVSIYQQNHQNASLTSNNNSTPTSKSTSSTKKLQGTELSNFTPISNISKLSYVDTTPGTGAVATASSKVTVVYTGAVAATGTIFQSTSDTGGSPVTFSLNQVIPGWQQGIPGMKVGGTRRLYIPANLAYGANPPSGSGIPANASLVFDVTLLKVQ